MHLSNILLMIAAAARTASALPSASNGIVKRLDADDVNVRITCASLVTWSVYFV